MNYRFDVGIVDCCWGRVAGFGVGCRLAGINMTAGINKSVDSTSVLGGYSPCVVVFVLMCTILFEKPLYKNIKQTRRWTTQIIHCEISGDF